MRVLAAALAILTVLAGCVNAPDEPADAATLETASATVPVAPFMAEGTLWLPPSSGQERVETLLPFPVNASGSALVAHVVLGSQYGPIELPETTASVIVELRAPDGTVLAEGEAGTGSREVELAVESAEALGEYALVLLSYGGSDGAANGDHAHWGIEVTPPSARGSS